MQTKNKVRDNIINEARSNKNILDYRQQDPNQVASPESMIFIFSEACWVRINRYKLKQTFKTHQTCHSLLAINETIDKCWIRIIIYYVPDPYLKAEAAPDR